MWLVSLTRADSLPADTASPTINTSRIALLIIPAQGACSPPLSIQTLLTSLPVTRRFPDTPQECDDTQISPGRGRRGGKGFLDTLSGVLPLVYQNAWMAGLVTGILLYPSPWSRPATRPEIGMNEAGLPMEISPNAKTSPVRPIRRRWYRLGVWPETHASRRCPASVASAPEQ